MQTAVDSLPAELRALADQVRAASADARPLRIRGGGSKDFYGGRLEGEPLDVTAVAGITSYEPTELVVTARAGTRLAELEAALETRGQSLPFEPPRFAFGAGSQAVNGAYGVNAAHPGTVGGMVAAGLAGPARASVGSVRDFVQGVTLLNGRGEVLSFGGQVMKNVAGYDVSRLMAGSLGVLGVIVEVSLKVLPQAPATATLRFPREQAEAIRLMNEWAAQPLPVNASAWWDDMLVLRLRGAHAAVRSAMQQLGGDVIDASLASHFWAGLRDQRDEFFVKAEAAVAQGGALWRLAVPATTAPLPLSGETLIEWGGAQRWLCTSAPAAVVREAAAKVGGHAVLWHAQHKTAGAFADLPAPLMQIHRDLKRAFDPAGIFNRGRLFDEF